MEMLKTDFSALNSLVHAKYIVFQNLCMNHDPKFIFGNELYRNKHDIFGERWKLKLGWFNNRSTSKATLMKTDFKKKPHFITFNLGPYFTSQHTNECFISYMNRHEFGIIFDELCRISDEGYAIVYRIPKFTSAHPGISPGIYTFIPPNSGSKLQIEADLLSPDFPYLDDKLPF